MLKDINKLLSPLEGELDSAVEEGKEEENHWEQGNVCVNRDLSIEDGAVQMMLDKMGTRAEGAPGSSLSL